MSIPKYLVIRESGFSITPQAELYVLSEGEGIAAHGIRVATGSAGQLDLLVLALQRGAEAEEKLAEAEKTLTELATDVRSPDIDITADAAEKEAQARRDETAVRGDMIRQVMTAVQEWELGWVTATRSMKIIEKMLQENHLLPDKIDGQLG